MKQYGYTKQEEVVAHYLTQKGIAFERQKRMVGYGNKKWIVDFFLPQHEILLECKESDQARVNDNTTMAIAIYKDFYKLDELGKRYNLSKAILIKAKKIRLSLIRNANAHNIYILSNVRQIEVVIQSLNIIKNNLDVLSEINETDYTIQKIPKKPSMNSEEARCAHLYAKGKSMIEIGASLSPPKHKMQVVRLLRKFLDSEFQYKQWR